MRDVRLLLDPPWSRREPRRCEADDCSSATREGKPYCTSHIFLSPYVLQVMAVNEAAGAEVDYLARRLRGGSSPGRLARYVDLEGQVAQDVLGYLRVSGTASAAGMARDLSGFRPGQQVVAEVYLRALERAGMVQLGKTRRGYMLAWPAEEVTGE